jgi:hypothetical protein
MSFFTSTELVYARRRPPFGDLVGGFPEHWDICDSGGAIVATIEENMSPLGRAARFLSSRFAYQQRHRLEVLDSSGRPLLVIVKPPPKLGLEYAEVRSADGAGTGTVRLIRPEGSDFPGLGLYDRHDTRLAEARENRKKAGAPGHRTYEVSTGDGGMIGEFASTTTRGDYRLRAADGLAEPLRSLMRAAPVVGYYLQ